MLAHPDQNVRLAVEMCDHGFACGTVWKMFQKCWRDFHILKSAARVWSRFNHAKNSPKPCQTFTSQQGASSIHVPSNGLILSSGTQTLTNLAAFSDHIFFVKRYPIVLSVAVYELDGIHGNVNVLR
jgi:hypothetical protein